MSIEVSSRDFRKFQDHSQSFWRNEPIPTGYIQRINRRNHLRIWIIHWRNLRCCIFQRSIICSWYTRTYPFFKFNRCYDNSPARLIYSKKWETICFWSNNFSKTKRQYSATERKTFSVVWSIRTLRPYIKAKFCLLYWNVYLLLVLTFLPLDRPLNSMLNTWDETDWDQLKTEKVNKLE